MRIGVDIMGSESSPKMLFEAVIETAEETGGSVHYVVFATQETAAELLQDVPLGPLEGEAGSRIDLCLAKDFITMEEDPLTAVRLKKGSSLALGIKHLGEGSIDAFVTSGNTGALIASATINLTPLGNFERPGLLAVLPTKDASLAMVDVGGNISCKSLHLVQYAHIGAAFQRCMRGIEVPKIGLLNIGVESKKGTLEVREAWRVLKEQSGLPGAKIAFVGNVEGREVFQGKVDVLVTDGFTGNVMLKTSEGLSSFIFEHIQDILEYARSEQLHQTLDRLQSHFNYEEYPGALVCGVDGIVIKCHGAATKKALKNSLLGAARLVQNNLISKIRTELSV